MINVFRREMKKWHTFLWVVLLSMALSSLAILFYRTPSARSAKVASVDGSPVYLSEYQMQLSQLRAQIEMLQNYAESQGVMPEWFLSLYGLDNPEKKAFDNVVSNKLLDKIPDDFNMHIAPKFFLGNLARSLPQQLIGPDGQIDQRRYREYLSRMYMTIPEYEEQKEDELKRELAKTIVNHSAYISKYYLNYLYQQQNQKKSFSILTVPFSKYLDQVEKEKPSSETLKKFFNQRKEAYRIAEKRKAKYWVLKPQEYEKNLDIQDSAINAFYDRNKTDLFRVPPEVKIRKVVVAEKEDAEKIHKEVVAKKEQTVEIAKKMGAKTRVVDFFKRGSYDVEFEKEAFRLKEKNDISNVIRTEEGFEILQLVERKPATYKPVDSVRDEIVKTLKAKKALNTLRADLEKVTYEARDQKDAIEKFATSKKLKTNQTDWLISSDTKGEGVVPKLVTKLFVKKATQRNFGYFIEGDEYVLYREIERKKSEIPSFEKIQKKVLSDYYNKEARKKEKDFVNNQRKNVLTGKTTLKNLSEKENLKLTKTGLIDKESNVAGIDFKDLVPSAFELSDSSQVLMLKHNKDYYLIQLENTSRVEGKDDKEEMDKLLKSEEESKKAQYLNAFIASLLRNAKIEKEENFLN